MAVLGVAVVALSACGGSTNVTRPAAGAGEVRPDAVPPTLLGLATDEEDVGKPFEEAGGRAFVTSVRLWSLRQGERLRATVQVARFAPDAPATTSTFQRTVAGQVGGSAPKLRKVDDHVVHVSAGNRQVFYMWFRGIHFVLLSVPVETTNGRALLRAALQEVKP